MNNQIYIQIPISESDLELFKDLVYSGETFDWSFESECSDHTVNVTFIKDN